MPGNNLLGGLLNFFMPKNTPPLGPGRAGGYPGLGGAPGGFPGFTRPQVLPPQGGGLFGSKPGGGYPGIGPPGKPGGLFPFGTPGGIPGLPGFGAPGAGNAGLPDLFNLLRSVDIGKVINGLNTFRTTLSNLQKIAQVINQLGTLAGNLNQIMKNVDVNSLLSMLAPAEEGEGDGGENQTETPPNFSSDESKDEPVTAHYTKKRTQKKKKVSVRPASVKRKKKKAGANTPLIQMKGYGGTRKGIKG